MDSLLFFFTPFLYMVILVFTVVWSLRSLLDKAPKPGRIAYYFQAFFEALFTIAAPAIGFSRFDQYGPNIPFSVLHVRIIIMIVVFSSLCFWLAKLAGTKPNPFLKKMISAGMAAGLLLCIVTAIHFGSYNLTGLIFPLLGFELLSPLACAFILVKELYLLERPVNEEAERPTGIIDLLPEHGQVPGQSPWKNVILSLVWAQPFLLALMGLNTLMGHPFLSVLYAYTESVGFVFSGF